MADPNRRTFAKKVKGNVFEACSKSCFYCGKKLVSNSLKKVVLPEQAFLPSAFELCIPCILWWTVVSTYSG